MEGSIYHNFNTIKMRRCKIYIVGLLFAYTSLSAQERVGDTIPFTNPLGLIVVPITFNGELKQFAFDTGAARTLGYGWVQETLKPLRRSITVTSSSGSKTRIRQYQSGTITLGNHSIRKHRILGRLDSEIFSCYGIDGILGDDIIDKFNWLINFEEKYLVQYPADFYPAEVQKMTPLPMQYGDRPFVYLTMANGVKLRFLLDTGASHSDISEKYTLDLSQNKAKHVAVYSAYYDVNGHKTTTTSELIQFKNVSAGNLKLSPLLDYSAKTNKLGNTLWKGNTLFLSLKNQKLYSELPQINEERMGYDCGVIVEDGKMEVIRIVADSAPWKAGLRQGAKIAAIDGKVFTDFFSLRQYQKKQAERGLDITLTLPDGQKLVLERKRIL